MRKFVLLGLLLLCGVVVGITFSPNGDVNEMYDLYLSTNSTSLYSVMDRGTWEELQAFTNEVSESGGMYLVFPLKPKNGEQLYISSMPGPRSTVANSGLFHTGIDLAVGGDPSVVDVVFATDGVITFSGYRPPSIRWVDANNNNRVDGDEQKDKYSGGNQVHVKTTLNSGIQVTFKYLHLENTPEFQVGDTVNAGDLVGNWGHSGDEGVRDPDDGSLAPMGVHLHFEVEVGTGQPNIEESMDGPSYTILNPFEPAYFVYERNSILGTVKVLRTGDEYEIKTQ